MAKRSSKSDEAKNAKTIKDIENLQAQFKEIMSSEFNSLQGQSEDRRDQLARLHNRFLQSIQRDIQNVNYQKSPNQSTYDFIASALTGRDINDTKDTKERNNIRKQLDLLFSGGDSEISSYFMANGISNMHIYDEIDSICAYMYQLDEAVDIIRDDVLSSEQSSEGISMDIKFAGLSDEDSGEYKQIIMDMFRDEGMTRKLYSTVIPKAIKYGKEYIMGIPYSEISEKLHNLKGGYGTFENTALFESAENLKNGSSSEYTLESVMADVAEILEVNTSNNKKNDSKKPKSKQQILYDTICNNIKGMTVCENNDAPNVSGLSYKTLSNLDDSMIDAVVKGMAESKRKTNATTTPRKGTKQYQDGLLDKTELEGIKGCYTKAVDPRQMRPIKIFDYTIGYYYIENYDFEYTGTSITDMLSNTMNFDTKTQTADRIVDSVLRKLKYGDIVSGDKQFRNLILNCLLYAERRDNPIRIKFVPTDYVIPFETNLDENDNGQPVLLRSLFFARLYISLVLFYMTAIITKSTDSEFYYLRESALDPKYDNQVTDVMDQLQQCNIDPISLANGNMLNAGKAVNKRYFMSIGTSGDKAFDIDVMSGQNIDINNDFLTSIKRQAISSTSVPSLKIDAVDEIDYAVQANIENIKHQKRCNSIQEDFNDPITKYAQMMARYTTNMPEDIISKMYITLRPSKINNNNTTNNAINDTLGIADAMVKTWYRGDNSGDLSQFDQRVMDKLRKKLSVELTPSAPWEKMDKFLADAIIEVRSEMERDNAIKRNEDQDSSQ